MSDQSHSAGDVAVATASTSTTRRARVVPLAKRKTVGGVRAPVRGGKRRGNVTNEQDDECEDEYVIEEVDMDAPSHNEIEHSDKTKIARNISNTIDGDNDNDNDDVDEDEQVVAPTVAAADEHDDDGDDDEHDDGDDNDDGGDDDDDDEGDAGRQPAKRRIVADDDEAADYDGTYNQRASTRKASRKAAAAVAPYSPSASPVRAGGGGGADGDVAKGLRHFSLKVCRKVEAKGTTNYAEVADELVTEYKRESEKAGAEISLIDQKNIRRRVYDALNVLRAMNVITKIKKAITWVGLPSADPSPDGHVQPGITSITAAAAAASSTRSSAAMAAAAAVAAHNSTAMLAKRLAEARDTREAVTRRIQAKKQQHEELMAQQIWYRNLLSRNEKYADELLQVERITLPFIVLNTRADTVIKCQVSPKQTDYFFSFSEPFEVHDDNEILKRMHQRRALVSSTPQPPQAFAQAATARSTFEQQLPSLSAAATTVASSAPQPKVAPPQFPLLQPQHRPPQQQPTAMEEDEGESTVVAFGAVPATSMSRNDSGAALLEFVKANGKSVSPDGAEAVAALMAASQSPNSQKKPRRLRLNE